MRALAGGGQAGLAPIDQIGGKTGREILEAKISGGLPYPMNDTMMFDHQPPLHQR